MSYSEIPWTAARQTSLSITNSQSSPKPSPSVMPSNHLILLLPSIFPSIRVFSNESTLHMRWPKYWSFSISPSSEHPGLISFRMDWLDLLAVQGTLKSLLQHHSWKHQFFGLKTTLKNEKALSPNSWLVLGSPEWCWPQSLERECQISIKEVTPSACLALSSGQQAGVKVAWLLVNSKTWGLQLLKLVFLRSNTSSKRNKLEEHFPMWACDVNGCSME